MDKYKHSFFGQVGYISKIHPSENIVHCKMYFTQPIRSERYMTNFRRIPYPNSKGYCHDYNYYWEYCRVNDLKEI